MKKLKLLCAVAALIFGVSSAYAETDYTSLMGEWHGDYSSWGVGKMSNTNATESYREGSDYQSGWVILSQSITIPVTGIYEIKFYAVTSSTSGRGWNNEYGPNIAEAFATAGSNEATLPMTVINQTGCTPAEESNIRTLSIEAKAGETLTFGLRNIGNGGNWYVIQNYTLKMKTISELFQSQYDEALNIYNNSTESEVGAKATFKTFVDALLAAMSGTLAEAQEASDNLAAALVTYESKSYPVKGSGVKYDFTSKMSTAINAWTCKQGNGPNQYGFTGATETYGNTQAGEVMYNTISGLANGEYEIHFYAVANAANGGGTAGTGLTYVYANDTKLDIEVFQQNSCTPSDYERTLTVMVKDGSIKYGITNYAAAGNWYICKNVSLFMTGAPDLDDYYDAIETNLETANGYVGKKMGPKAASDLETAINNAEGYNSITIINSLESINQCLIDANSQAAASITDYDNLKDKLASADANYQPLEANVNAYRNAISAAQAVYDNASVDNCSETITSITTAFQTANVADYNSIKTDYPHSLISKIGEFSTWTMEATSGEDNDPDTPQTLDSEHWSGAKHTYYEQGKNGWSSTRFTVTYTKTATLPVGSYVIKVAARASDGVTGTLSATATENETALPNIGAYGKGINKAGKATWTEGEFARNGEGYGWQWRFLPFTVTEEGEVTITIKANTNSQYQWVSIADAELLSAEDIATAVAYKDTESNTIENVDVANVTITRKVTEGFNTVVLPFDLTQAQVQSAFGSGALVYAYSENSENSNNVTINFNSVSAGTISANVPVLVKATETSESQTFNGVKIVAAQSATVTGTNFDFVGTYAPIANIPAGDYFVGYNTTAQAGAIFKSEGATSINAFRAYIHAKTAGARVSNLYIDGEQTTNINTLEAVGISNGKIYNLNGQEVKKAQKGIYIVNGKKLLVK